MSDTLEITRQKWQRWIDTLAGESDDSIVKRLNEAAEKIDSGVVRKLLTVCLCGCCPGRLV